MISTPPPPRRRRIAGERRRPSAPGDPGPADPGSPPADTAAADSAPPTDSSPAVSLEKTPGPAARPRRRLPSLRRSRGGAAAPSRSGSTWWGRPATLVALAVALVVMLTLIGLGAFGMLGNTGVDEVQEAEEAQVAAETAPSVAERAAEAILAYDYRSLDTDQAAAEKFMTGEFAEEYSTTFDRTVKSAARTYRAQVTAQVRSSSVVRAGADEVKVLLFVDQTTRSTAHQRPQVALNRVEFVMVQQDGEWLVDDISSY